MDPAARTLTRRRTDLRLPSVAPHLVGATSVLALLLIGTPLLANVVGDASDARPGGSIGVELPIPEEVSPLDAQTEDLPDLLGGEVLMGVNPTSSIADEQRVDALGNPLVNTPAAPADVRRTVTLPARASGALRPVDPALRRDGRFGPIPAPGPDGTTPLTAYRKSFVLPAGRKPVSIIVGGLGINGRLTQRAIDELPAEVTLGFAAHAPNLQEWIDRARLAGHEVLLEIPMESSGFDPSEPGAERALRVDASLSDNRDNLHKLLTRAQGYAGVINYNGDRVLPRSDVTAPILSELSDAGLGFIADGSFSAPSLQALAASSRLPYRQAFGLIDPSPDRPVIDARLSELSALASSQAGAVGVGFAYPQTLDAVKGWAATLAGNDLALVPATAALR